MGQQLPLATDLGLENTTIVVVDLETTGLSPESDHIIEIGAIKTRAGRELGRFSTFVRPPVPIPANISSITSITDKDVADAPQISTAMADFIEFAEGCLLVAHNAKFDLGFLRQAATVSQLRWTPREHLCTYLLARKLVSRQEVGSYRLSSLAQFFGASATPSHRAITDAEATVDVFYGLVERLGTIDIGTVGEAKDFSTSKSGAPRHSSVDLSKYRYLLEGIPHAPGVYLFRGEADSPLYIGTATDLRRRVLQYFTGTDKRRRLQGLLPLTKRIEVVECANGFEAEVREAKLIARHRPPMNARSKEPQRGWWISCNSQDAATVLRSPLTDIALGPFRSQRTASDIAQLLGLIDDAPRDTISTTTRPRIPCLDESGSAQQRIELLLVGGEESGQVCQALIDYVLDLAQQGRFQRAALSRDLVATFISVLAREQLYRSFTSVPYMEFTAPNGDGGWDVAIIRHGQLAATCHIPVGASAEEIMRLTRASAKHVSPEDSPFAGASIEELRVVTKWLARPGVRPGAGCMDWTMPIGAANRYHNWVRQAREAEEADRHHRHADRRRKSAD